MASNYESTTRERLAGESDSAPYDLLEINQYDLSTPAPDHASLMNMVRYASEFQAAGPGNYQTASDNTAPDIYVRRSSYPITDSPTEVRPTQVLSATTYQKLREIADIEHWKLSPGRYAYLSRVAMHGLSAGIDAHASVEEVGTVHDLTEAVIAIQNRTGGNLEDSEERLRRHAYARLSLHDTIVLAAMEEEEDWTTASSRADTRSNLTYTSPPPATEAVTDISDTHEIISHRKPSSLRASLGRMVMGAVRTVMPTSYSSKAKHKYK